MSHDETTNYIYGLYFNENTPMRQEVITTKKQDFPAVRALVAEDATEDAV